MRAKEIYGTRLESKPDEDLEEMRLPNSMTPKQWDTHMKKQNRLSDKVQQVKDDAKQKVSDLTAQMNESAVSSDIMDRVAR